MPLKQSAPAPLIGALIILAGAAAAQPNHGESARGPAGEPAPNVKHAPKAPPTSPPSPTSAAKTGAAPLGSMTPPKTAPAHAAVRPATAGHALSGAGGHQPNGAHQNGGGGPHAAPGASRGAVSQAGGAFRLSPSTTLTLRPKAPAMTITQTDSEGPTVVVKQRYAGGQPLLLSAYTSRTNAATGAVTRTYLDGHVVETGKGFERYEIPGRFAVTTRSNGLRQATGIDGRPLYRESYETRLVNGVATLWVIRTVFSEMINNQFVVYPEPQLRTYAVQTFHGARLFAYQPAQFDAGFYAPLLAGFPQPIPVGPACDICPPPTVVFEQPVKEYTDPLALVGDLQITGPYTDGPGLPPPATDPAAPPPAANPDVDYLSQKVSDLQQQVDSAKTDDPQLDREIESMPPPAVSPAPPAASPPTPASPPPSASPPAPAPTQSSAQHSPSPATTAMQPTVAYVPEDVRRQIHAQVRENVRLHEANQPLTWTRLVNSGQSKAFIFQVSEVISTVNTNGEDCALTGGDMLRMADDAAPDDPAIRMRVINSKPTSCATATVVSISVADVQNMLNDFNARQENNMKQVHKKLAGTTQI